MSKTGDRSRRRQNRILMGAIVLALLIMAGSTFAWYSAREEVTNQLIAKVDYNVAIQEEFTAPESWEPGETVNKVVGLVNTGDLSAFGGIAVSNQMRVAFWETEVFNSANTAKYQKLSTEDVLMLRGSQADEEPVEGINLVSGVDYIDADGKEVKREAAFYFDGSNCYAMSADSSGSWRVRKPGDMVAGVPTLDYSKITTDNKIVATYTSGDKTMVVNILLDSNWAANWTFDGDHSFYLKSTITGGTSSAKLIRALQLDNSIVDGTYVNFDYALIVESFSAQIQPSTTLAAVAETANASNWTMKATGGIVAPNGKSTTVTNIVWSPASGA